jgi:hypothetical protein
MRLARFAYTVPWMELVIAFTDPSQKTNCTTPEWLLPKHPVRGSVGPLEGKLVAEAPMLLVALSPL